MVNIHWVNVTRTAISQTTCLINTMPSTFANSPKSLLPHLFSLFIPEDSRKLRFDLVSYTSINLELSFSVQRRNQLRASLPVEVCGPVLWGLSLHAVGGWMAGPVGQCIFWKAW